MRFRERQEVSSEEATRFAVEMGLASGAQKQIDSVLVRPKIIERALSQGGLQMEHSLDVELQRWFVPDHITHIGY